MFVPIIGKYPYMEAIPVPQSKPEGFHRVILRAILRLCYGQHIEGCIIPTSGDFGHKKRGVYSRWKTKKKDLSPIGLISRPGIL